MIPPLDHPANALLLRWLAPIGVQVPALLREWEVDRYTLLAAPELTARMLALAAARPPHPTGAGSHWAVHGFPALVGDDGQVDVVVAGHSTLVVRCDEPPADELPLTGARPPFGWIALDAWGDDGPLVEVIRSARSR